MGQRKFLSSYAVTIFVFVILALAAVFAWKVFGYYRAIKSGDISKLPQFTSQLTFSPKLAQAGSGKLDRAELETSDDPSFGTDNPKLTIVEFLDYECPFSRDASDVVRRLAAKYASDVRFIIRDFPILELHPNAILAAQAAGCAEEQGKYWQVHDRFFAEGAPLTREKIDRIVGKSGLDEEKYLSCMNSGHRLDEIKGDVDTATAAGLRGTPTFFFNGQKVEGSIPESMFEQLILGFIGE